MFTPVLTMFTQSQFSGSITYVACHSHACGVRAEAGALESTYFVVGQTDVKSPHLNFTKIGNISPDPEDLLVDYPC